MFWLIIKKIDFNYALLEINCMILPTKVRFVLMLNVPVSNFQSCWDVFPVFLGSKTALLGLGLFGRQLVLLILDCLL